MGKRLRRAEIFEPRSPRRGRVSLSLAIPEFLDGYRYDGSPKTLALYTSSLSRFGGFLAQKGRVDPGVDPGVNDLTLDDIRPPDITRYLIAYADGHAASQVRKQYDYLHRFFAWCVEQEYLDVSPLAKVRAPRVPDAARVGFSREEIASMLYVNESKPGPIGARDRAIVAVLLDTGVRAAELVGMRLGDIEWAHRRILVHGKGQKDRRVPFGAKTARLLQAWLKARYAHSSDALWLNQRRAVLTYANLSKMLELLGGYAGVEGVTPHRFRHSYATAFYRQHKDLLALQRLLGHSEAKTTLVYLRSLGVQYGADADYKSPGEWLL